MTNDKKNVIRVSAEPQNSLRSRVFIAQNPNDPSLIQVRLVVGFSQRDERSGSPKEIKEFLADLLDREIISKEDHDKARRGLSNLSS